MGKSGKQKARFLALAGLVLLAVSCKSLMGGGSAPAPEASTPQEGKLKETAATADGQTSGTRTEAETGPSYVRKEVGIYIREMASGEISSGKALTMNLDRLSRSLARKVTGQNPTMAVATFVDMDRLNRSNTFGRYVTENLMGHMSDLGFKVVEHRAAKRLLQQPNVGAHALTEETGEMMNAWKADSVLLGTYKKSGNTVMVHARLVSTGTQQVIAAADMEMTFEKDDALVKDLFDNALERVYRADGQYEGWKK
ncbi:MAG: hypothetical protein HZA04_10005 [Nitrospinae bacterium]|nr:hypothetical protein [Nitrospinota bacterium]